MLALKNVIDMARRERISTIVIASTTGDTALKLFELAKDSKLKLIVVTHDEGNLQRARRFKEAIRELLLANGVTVYTHDVQGVFFQKIVGEIAERLGLPTWRKHLMKIREKFGTGIKVCYIIVRMLMEGNILRDQRVVAVAGKGNGADSSAVFLVRPRNKWPVLEKVFHASREQGD